MIRGKNAGSTLAFPAIFTILHERWCYGCKDYRPEEKKNNRRLDRNAVVQRRCKKHGVTHQTVKRIVSASPDIAQKVQQKKEENTADMMAYMESQKAAMQEAITLHLKALTDPEKISAATLSQIATSFGIIVDKATRNTASGNDSLNKLDGLIKEFRNAIKPETD